MRIRLYQVYDRVAGCVIGPILAARTDAVAVRQFRAAMVAKDSTMVPRGDFDLVNIGEQEDGTGEVVGRPEVVITGGSIVEGDDHEA